MDTMVTNPRYLFSTFLEDKKVFNLAEAYWRRLVRAVASEGELDFHSYLNHYDSQGRKEYHANPIFDAFFPGLSRAVRIIQEAPEADVPDIAAWVDTIELEEGAAPVPELVIALALSRDTSQIARRLIRSWIVQEPTPEAMRAVIDVVLREAGIGEGE